MHPECRGFELHEESKHFPLDTDSSIRVFWVPSGAFWSISSILEHSGDSGAFWSILESTHGRAHILFWLP